MQTDQVLDELRHLCEQFQAPGWDGRQALPLARATIQHAVEFVEALPARMSAPSVGAEPDGQLTLEWYRTPRHVLSVSVTAEGDLHYAALLGRNRHYGTIAAG